MRIKGIGLLAAFSAALVVGCGADVDKPSDSFVGEVDLGASASGPGTLVPGTNALWTFSVTNAGPEPANDVDVDFYVATPPTIASTDEILLDLARWTCQATAGSCAAASGTGTSTSVSLQKGGQAVFTLRVPLSYQTPEGWTIEGGLVVGQDGTYPDPDTGDNTDGALASVTAAQTPADFRDEIIYWAFTDRFANGDPSNDNAPGTRRGDEADPDDSIAWHGGDFAGIEQKIEEGYFQGMGFTAIWISPVILQVPALSNGNAAYHGYWPEATLEIEPHFGTIADLKSLVDTAHANGLKIILDFVANHVGFDAQVIQTDRDWVRLGSECGTEEQDLCLAGLPDLKQENPEVEAFLLSSIRNLVQMTGADAFRWDAIKHVNTDFWTAAFAPGAAADRATVWSVGESFDVLDPEKIAFYMDTVGTPGMLDFPLYFGLGGQILGFTDRIAGTLATSDPFFSDSTRLVTFMDNHDVERVATRLERDRALSPAVTIQALDAMTSFLYGARGIPAIYYGTEIAMRGVGDPFSFRNGDSNREDMNFELAGDPNVRTCGIADQGLDNTEAFGTTVFLRGAFNDWGAVDPLYNTGGGIYSQALELGAGTYAFKVAAEDWSLERTYDAAPVVADTPVTMNTGGGNTNLELADGGCYRFDLDTSASTDNPELTVTRLNVAAPLVRRLAELAAARQAYPALRRGTQTVLYDYGKQCSVPATWPPPTLPGQLFLRGGFNDWGATAETGFVRTDVSEYQAEFSVAAGNYGYKIATEDWSFERVVAGQDTAPGSVLPLVNGAGQPNGNLVIAADGCYNFAIDAADLDAMTLEVTADTDGTCGVVSQDPDAAAFGQPVYVRNSYAAFSARETDRFAATGPDTLTARVGMVPTGTPYKIASEDWSVERAVAGGPTQLDSRQLLVVPSADGVITPPEPGCYEWTIDASDPGEAYLTVSGPVFPGSDLMVLRRDLAGEASVWVVYNAGAEADLSLFDGLPVDGLPDGAPVELTGRDNDLVVSGGRLHGTIPSATTYLLSDR